MGTISTSTASTTSGFRGTVTRAFALLGSYAALVGIYRRFGTIYRSHLQGSTRYRTDELSRIVGKQLTMPCNIPEVRRPHTGSTFYRVRQQCNFPLNRTAQEAYNQLGI